MLVPALPVTLGKPLLFPAPYSLSLCKGRAAWNVCRAPALPLALPLAPLAAGSGRWQALAAGWHRCWPQGAGHKAGLGDGPLLRAYAGLLQEDPEKEPVMWRRASSWLACTRSWVSVAWPCPSKSHLLHSWVGQCSQHPCPGLGRALRIWQVQ